MSRNTHRKYRSLAAAAVIAAGTLGFGAAALADSVPHNNTSVVYKDGQWQPFSFPGKGPSRADDHAPIGVMGDHRHKQGEIMLSYRFMRMWMEDNLIGTDGATPETIATTVQNIFFGQPMQPPTLRVVPINMMMDMQMYGAMYGLTDQITLMGMVPYIEKEMEHITFQGPVGTVRRGAFTTRSQGFGDISGGALIGVIERHGPDSELHVDAMFSLSAPTGSTKQQDNVLTPLGTRPIQRLPYPMQLGSGTWDALPGVIYTQRQGNLSWGAQWRGTYRLEDENDQGYSLGDKNIVTGWLAHQWAPWISTSGRIFYTDQDSIDGIDPVIVAPVQTANPNFQGGERVDLLVGVNLIGQREWGPLCGHRLALEYGQPIHQDLNGPQLETDWTFMVGWQKTLGDC